MQNKCPACSRELEWNDGRYVCTGCVIKYKKLVDCPDCSAEMEKLQACGAASYFCDICNELKSKSRVVIKFSPIA